MDSPGSDEDDASRRWSGGWSRGGPRPARATSSRPAAKPAKGRPTSPYSGDDLSGDESDPGSLRDRLECARDAVVASSSPAERAAAIEVLHAEVRAAAGRVSLQRLAGILDDVGADPDAASTAAAAGGGSAAGDVLEADGEE